VLAGAAQNGRGAANIAYNLLRAAGGDNVTGGSILLGAARPVQVHSPPHTLCRRVSITALAAMANNR
jgi:malate dehydrogenase (oxaloacetate-decarboxylating)(NADP+)